ncbi:XdhC family protein [Luteimonas abyssi]|uniref:XdhC family protein n=1 Tax=Luteimonas abyssi TaxID=1247514 RepID=UPI0009EB5F15|nr:XdhC/CoxI family protein [Luteimonas abyssi]
MTSTDASTRIRSGTVDDTTAVRAVLAESCGIDAQSEASAAVLALVLETEGSTYAGVGGLALFSASGQSGWLSGGCLEPEIARRAETAAHDARIEFMEIDTRDDDALFAGSATGCRGRLRLALVPLAGWSGYADAAHGWLDGGHALQVSIATNGYIEIASDAIVARHRLPADAPAWADAETVWSLRFARLPELVAFGAGPETEALLPHLRRLGWRCTLVERRERWQALTGLADTHLALSPRDALAALPHCDAALVMHHGFESDLDALDALADSGCGFVGLLGPVRRREDLMRLLPASRRDALLPVLRSPIGLALGGRGADAIALSIVAQLQQWRHGG